MSYDPNQPPGPEPGPHYEYSNYNPYSEPQIPYETAYAPYGAPNQGPTATPLPLGEAVEQLPRQYWKVLSRPGAATFAEEAGKASWDIILLQLISYAVIAAVLAVLQNIINPPNTSFLNQLNSNAGVNNQSAALAITNSPALTVIFSLSATLIGFFIGQGILFGLAKAFGGQGTFTQQAYVFLLFQVPLGILEGIVGLVPVVGGLIALAGTIYEIVLAVFAIMGVHRLSGGKASAVVLIPIGVVFLLACCAIALLVVALANNPNIR